REEQAVEAVKDATVSGYNPARVLGAEGALEGRLAEVAERGEDRDGQRDTHRFPVSEGEEDGPADERDDDAAHETADRALDGLAGADGGQQLVTPPGAAREVPAGVGAHRRVDGEEHPAPAVGLLAEKRDVRDEEADVEDAEQQRAHAADGER